MQIRVSTVNTAVVMMAAITIILLVAVLFVP